MAEMFVFFILAKFRTVNCYIRAWLWNIQNIDDTIRQRRLVQGLRKVGDREILNKMYFGSGKFLILKKIGLPKFK